MRISGSRVPGQYEEILGRATDGAGRAVDPQVRSRLLEMSSSLEFAETIGSSLELGEILDVLLLTALGKMTATTGAVLVREEPVGLAVHAARGPVDPALRGARIPLRRPFRRPQFLEPAGRPPNGRAAGPARLLASPLLAPLGLQILVPIWRKGRFIGAFGLGRRLDGRPYAAADLRYLFSLAEIASTAIENGLIHQELRGLNRRLQLKLLQLTSLFEASRELVSSFDPEQILRLMVNSLAGQTAVRRCALLSPAGGGRGLALALERGLTTRESEHRALARLDPATLPLFDQPHHDLADVRRLSPSLARLLTRWGLVCAFPLRSGERCHTLLVVGPRLDGSPPSDEDREFIATLCSLAVTAMENAALHNDLVEKERWERELSLARKIQQGLLPRAVPVLPGLEIAQISLPCHEVGGDFHDFLLTGGESLGLAVGDVAGKGMPAALVMSSILASLRALRLRPSGTLAETIGLVNNLLFRSTESNRFASFFFGELDLASGRLDFVNAGHNPPLRVGRSGRAEPLSGGGMVLGLFENAPYQGQVASLDPGDILLLYTDGLSEATRPDGEEFGERRIGETARRLRLRSAEEIARGVLEESQRFQEGLRPHDDLTLVVVKRRRASPRKAGGSA